MSYTYPHSSSIGRITLQVGFTDVVERSEMPNITTNIPRILATLEKTVTSTKETLRTSKKRLSQEYCKEVTWKIFWNKWGGDFKSRQRPKKWQTRLYGFNHFKRSTSRGAFYFVGKTYAKIINTTEKISKWL